MLKLPKCFLDDEEREGFLVKSEMKSYWASQIEILKVIDDICSRHGLKYFAAYGTLLGAARHSGYIPWDDDVDIAMLREDYDTFLNIAKNEMPKGYDIYNIHLSADWKQILSRVVNGDMMRVEEFGLIQNHGCPYNAGVDVFPLDYIPKSSKEKEEKDNYLHLAYSMATFDSENSGSPEEYGPILEQGLCALEDIFKFRFNREEDINNQLNCLFDFISSSYGKTRSNMITNYWNYEEHSKSVIFHELWFCEMIDLGFEITTVKAPIGVEAVLNMCFGNNFMTPVKNTAAHDYPSYKLQRERLMELGILESVNEKREKLKAIMCSDDAKYVKEDIKQPLPEKLYQDIKGKKIVLYALNSASIVRYGKDIFEKIKRSIDIFDEAKDDIAVILAEDITFLATLNDMYPDMFEKYMQLRQSICDNGIGVVSDDLYYDFAAVCDAYFGDGTTVIGDFKKANKPVMLQNYNI